MDSPSPSRQSGFSARNSTVDVSQLDKVNAIPNKAADEVLLSNLCPEDQHYLKFLMENDCSNSEDESEKTRHSSSGAWSPMVQSPMVNKRAKLRPSYARITLSLEDISYIRPSWGISKGIRTIEVDGKKNKKKLVEKSESIKESAAKDSETSNTNKSYRYFLLLLTVVVIFLTLPPYLADQRRHHNQVSWNKLRVSKSLRTMEIYRPSSDSSASTQVGPISGDPILRVNFALGVPANLKPEECTCDVYDGELRKRAGYSGERDQSATHLGCFSCLDWAVRANFRVLVERRAARQEFREGGEICYHLKWQSYDSLATPLIDCFSTVDMSDQWFGLGDIHSAEWPVSMLNFAADAAANSGGGWLLLATNLTAELQSPGSSSDHGNGGWPSFGSYADLTLFSTAGISISELRSDFRLAVRVEAADGGARQPARICIRASCHEKCSRVWSRQNDLSQLRHSNNVLEYRICSSASGAKSLISSHIGRKIQQLDSKVRQQTGIDLSPPPQAANPDNRSTATNSLAPEPQVASRPHLERLFEKVESNPALAAAGGSNHSLGFPEGIGLIERTIFSTSPEFMPVLDGKTLRQYVDSVVKMGLKTSSILLIDPRWETHIGSLQLNTALFPKWRLLFEIIHNKGFKVILTWKPFVDTVIGAASVNQLFEAGRLYGISQGLNRVEQDVRRKETILRRTGLFAIRNETIEIGQNGSTTSRPYVFKCKESQVGHCALLDLNRHTTRSWLAQQIGRSELLAPPPSPSAAATSPTGATTASGGVGGGAVVAADGILLAGSHPDGFSWDDHYREGLSDLVRHLFFRSRLFTLPQYTGDLGYIQLSPRPFTWQGLRSVLNSVLNLGLEGFSLVHPGSVWGDLKLSSGGEFSGLGGAANLTGSSGGIAAGRKEPKIYLPEDLELAANFERTRGELCTRWLQVSIFLPILQFNNLLPIERYGLQELLQSLIKTRKLHLIGELKRNMPFTPLISHSKFNSSTSIMPLIRPVWFNQQHLAPEAPDTIVAEQFSVGPDILVAPILSEGQRQRDVYLPSGFWHDELRQINMRGGKWLRNYPVELNEVAWFTRAKR